MNPTLFISHGAPNIILSDIASKKNIKELAEKLEMPKYIIIFSAHYLTKDLKIISPYTNKIMYDFYGFEEELYKVRYEINSDEKLTFELIEKLKKSNINISIDENRKSYDHGVWNVLALMYEKLSIPVLQLSIPISYNIEQLINLGVVLQQFKDEALIICSGGITHNLGDARMHLNIQDYATKFNDDIIDIIENAKDDELRNIQNNINFYKNHPSTEHFLPLFIAYGNAIDKKGKSFNKEMIYSNISMESFIFDEKELIN
ncbi:dioxygenase, 4,5-DOPA dioxygenase family [Arcobacter venerupis]|uniref:Dioxygenase, 4,5-DOPA dioxygenase family n=1 Tax=Arcobacter venerupis TaxID=1054033 RepID=A0AAE7E2Y5_9BACT|nr:class III extradiol ring-cleavage dioxygenase [Arcobacter venerupis]QKF65754.1 dioxygenase, 4,5-DOPA dioxygenase family [Arcobacter venerupis]RWS50264.1 dioxygenase [Arcobacter venerupis]